MNFLSLSVYWGLRFVFQRCGPISELFSSVRSEIVQDSWRAPQLNREQAPTRRQAWSKQPPSNTAQTVSWTRSCQTPWLYMQLGEHTHTHTQTWESLTAGQQSAAPLPHPTATTQTLTVRVQTADTRWEPHRNCSTELHVSWWRCRRNPAWLTVSVSVCVSVCVDQQQQQQHSCNSPPAGSEAERMAPSVGGVWVQQENNPQLSRNTDSVAKVLKNHTWVKVKVLF